MLYLGPNQPIIVNRRQRLFRRAYVGLIDEVPKSWVLGLAPASADGMSHEIRLRVTRPGACAIARN